MSHARFIRSLFTPLEVRYAAVEHLLDLFGFVLQLLEKSLRDVSGFQRKYQVAQSLFQ